MRNIGITMEYGLFGKPSAADTALLDVYGGLDRLMERYRQLGVSSIELSTVKTSRSMEEMRSVCQKIMDAGFHLTLHGTTEKMSGREHFDFFAPLYEDILKRQNEVTVTLHAPGDLELAVSILADWCCEGLQRYPQVLFVQENQRVHKPEHGEHFRINAIPATLPRLANIGICWDMGHYAFNVIKAGLPAETLPSPESMQLIRHTHIHGIVNMDTHYPVQGDPVTTYVKALKEHGYAGVYHLEVKPDKFMHAFPDIRDGMESSILRLQEMIRE